jgi:hypothetical protein
MTPKEKANELSYKFFQIVFDDSYAQQCAIIAINEMILWENESEISCEYLLDVRDEIIKL